ncbi:MAG: putative rane protein [Marmoricola sp.]|nr:putative rane protein [Marmoricola sp.]
MKRPGGLRRLLPRRLGARGAERTRRSEPTERTLWWTAFAGFAFVIVLWSFSMPLFASPDENAHVIKAAAVGRGELLGRDTYNAAGDTLTHVRVPAPQVSRIPCFAHSSFTTADCQKDRHRPQRLRDATTLAGHYQPAYYAVVGLGSVADPGRSGVYLMRVISGALNAALLASALLSVRRWRSGLGGLGLAVAVTPMTLFLSAGVNPSGVEITAAIGAWAALLALLADPVGASTRLVARLGVAASMLVLTRSLSPLWLAVLVVVCCLPTGFRPLRAALSRRDVQVCAAVSFVSTACAAGWITLAGGLTLRPNRGNVPLPFGEAFGSSIDRLPYRAHQMVGVFGWIDTWPLPITFRFWTWALLLLLLLCLVTARPLAIATLVALVAVVVVLPSIIEASQQQTLGFVWQGRYTLPIAVGVPLLAARFARPDRRWFPARARWVVATVVVLILMSAHVVAFVWDMRRYTVGAGGGTGLSGPLKWYPPLLPTWAYAALMVVGVVFLGWQLLFRASRPGARHDQPAPAPAAPATGAAGAAGAAGADQPVANA